jgi:hypothetical protein
MLVLPIQAELICLAPLAVQVLPTSEHAAHSAGRRPGGVLDLEITKATRALAPVRPEEVYLASGDRHQGGQARLTDIMTGNTCGSPIGICVHALQDSPCGRQLGTLRRFGIASRVGPNGGQDGFSIRLEVGSTPPAGPPKALPTQSDKPGSGAGRDR